MLSLSRLIFSTIFTLTVQKNSKWSSKWHHWSNSNFLTGIKTFKSLPRPTKDILLTFKVVLFKKDAILRLNQKKLAQTAASDSV